MENYLKNIEDKLNKKIKFEKLEIIDNSHKHKGHRYFREDRYHLHIKIESSYLSSMSRLNAQKIIMNILKEDLNTKIHALEISID